jgi:hypothetical protein
VKHQIKTLLLYTSLFGKYIVMKINVPIPFGILLLVGFICHGIFHCWWLACIVFFTWIKPFQLLLILIRLFSYFIYPWHMKPTRRRMPNGMGTLIFITIYFPNKSKFFPDFWTDMPKTSSDRLDFYLPGPTVQHMSAVRG